MKEIDFDKIAEDLKKDPTIKSVHAFYQPDGCPEMRIERFEDASVLDKLKVLGALVEHINSEDFDLGELQDLGDNDTEYSMAIRDINRKIIELVKQI